MTKCKNCRTTLSSSLIFKSLWKGYKKFDCSNCRAEYEFTFRDRLICALGIGISTFITSLIVSSFELDIFWKLILGLSLITVFSLVLSALCLSFFTFQIYKD